MNQQVDKLVEDIYIDSETNKQAQAKDRRQTGV